jgi:ribosome-associated toxin RatA of RatAB toxin-antitoxin module
VLAAAAALAAVTLPARSHAQPATFTPAEAARLDRGEVLTRFWRVPGSDAGAGWAVGVIDAPPEQVFRVVADVARYREFTPRMVASTIVSGGGDRYRFYYKLQMPWPLSDHECTTDNVHEVDRPGRRFTRRWTLVSGTFHHNEGAWAVRPWGKGQSLLTYSVVLLPKSAAPRAVLDYVTRIALPGGVKTFRRRVAELRQAGRR